MIEDQFGIKGGYIANRLLCSIYRNGYYIEWNEDMALVFSKRVGNGVSYSLANEVVHALVRRSFFDKALLERYGILTSRGIQKRWFDVITKLKRKASIIKEFNLLFEVNSPIPLVNTEETQEKEEETTQRKEKESKEESSSDEEEKTESAKSIQDQVEDFKKKEAEEAEAKKRAAKILRSPPVITLDEALVLFRNIGELKEAVCKNNSYSESEYLLALDMFIRTQKGANYVVKSESDLRKYFIFWSPNWRDLYKKSQNNIPEKGKIQTVLDVTAQAGANLRARRENQH